MPGKNSVEMFWQNVRKAEGDGCWEYQRTSHHFGYGRFKINGKRHYTHRLSWELHFGPLPKGKDRLDVCVLHRCDNPRCVRPDHLFLGTQRENMHDKGAKKRGRNAFSRSA